MKPSERDRAAMDAIEHWEDNPILRELAEQERREGLEARRTAQDAFSPPTLVIHQAKEIGPPQVKIRALATYRASELYGKALPPLKTVVADMVPVGLTVLAGAPKRGKSWLALKMGICVAAGDSFLGRGVQKGEVLYLDLESRQQRVQKRLSMLIPGRAPEGLHIAHEADKLDGGLMEQITLWCDAAKAPSLIIIDTLGRVKGATKRGENAYDADTRIFGELQSFAQKRALSVVCVHHFKKSSALDDDDWFEKITGSMGLPGVCDAVIALTGKRGEENSLLRISSRDFQDSDLVIRFKDGCWTLVSGDGDAWREEQAYSGSEVVRGVLRLMDGRDQWRGTNVELRDAIVEATGYGLMANGVHFGRELAEMARPLFERDGISVMTRRNNRQRIIEITKGQNVF